MLGSSYSPMVLIVDHDADARAALACMLERTDRLRILEAPDGLVALRMLETIPVDIVISDGEMPGMHGVELLQHVRLRWPQTRRVFYTGGMDTGVVLDAINRGGVNKALVKGSDVARIRRELDELVDECVGHAQADTDVAVLSPRAMDASPCVATDSEICVASAEQPRVTEGSGEHGSEIANPAVEPAATADASQERTAGGLIQSAVTGLGSGLAHDPLMMRALERLARVSRALVHSRSEQAIGSAIGPTHHALADVLERGRAIQSELFSHEHEHMQTLASAQRILFPLACTRGVAASRSNEDYVERRTSPRAELHVEVSLDSDTNFYQGFSEDVSAGGLFVATYNLAPIGTSFELEFTLPDGYVVRARAEVRWIRDLLDDVPDARPGMGLAFSALSEGDERAIGRFVNTRIPLFYDDEL